MTRRKSQPDESSTEPLETGSEDVTEIEEAIAPAPLPPEVFAYIRGRCPVCSEKIVTNLEGALFCPVKNKECPRNVSTELSNS